MLPKQRICVAVSYQLSALNQKGLRVDADCLTIINVSQIFVWLKAES